MSKFYPQQYWNDMNNQREFMDNVFKQLHYKDMSDWYKTKQEVAKGGKKGVKNKGYWGDAWRRGFASKVWIYAVCIVGGCLS